VTTAVVEGKVVHHPTAQDLKTELAVTQHQLDILGEYFLLALNQLPEGTLKVSLTEQALLGELPLALQARTDENGAVIFRAVNAN
jgi:hypothetical protein